MFLIAVGKDCGSEGTETKSSCCDGNNPLCIEMYSRGVEVWFDLFRSESTILIAVSDDERSLFFGPEPPWHGLLFSVGNIEVGVGAYPWHYLINIIQQT